MKRWSVGVVFLAVAGHSIAYDIATHPMISEEAATRSILASQQRFARLGLPAYTLAGGARKFPSSRNENLSILELIRFGSAYEDTWRPGIQALYHFYDPQNQGIGLTKTTVSPISRPL